MLQRRGGSAGAAQGEEQVVSVSTLDVGDVVLVHLQEGARHTGLKIVEEEWYEQ